MEGICVTVCVTVGGALLVCVACFLLCLAVQLYVELLNILMKKRMGVERFRRICRNMRAIEVFLHEKGLE